METTRQVSGQPGWEAAALNSAIINKEDFLPSDLIGHVSAFLQAVDRFNLSCVSKTCRKGVSLADRRHEDWECYQVFITGHLPDFIEQIPEGQIKQALTDCHAKLSQLDEAECTFLEKEAQFFRNFLVPIKRVYEYTTRSQNLREYVSSHPQVLEFLDKTYNYLHGGCEDSVGKWAKEKNFLLPRIIFKQCVNRKHFLQQLMEAFVKEGDMKNARPVFNAIREPSSIPIVMLCEGYIKQGQPKEVVPFMPQLTKIDQSDSFTEHLTSRITTLLIQHHYLDEALEASKMIGEIERRALSMIAVCEAFIIQDGLTDRVWSIIREEIMTDRKWSKGLYKQLLIKGQEAWAEELLERMSPYQRQEILADS